MSKIHEHAKSEFPLPVKETKSYDQLGRTARWLEVAPLGDRRPVITPPEKSITMPVVTVWELREYQIGRVTYQRWECDNISHRISTLEAWHTGPYGVSWNRISYATFERAVRACIIQHFADLLAAEELLRKFAPERLK